MEGARCAPPPPLTALLAPPTLAQLIDSQIILYELIYCVLNTMMVSMSVGGKRGSWSILIDRYAV